MLVRIEFQPTKDEITADFASYQIATYRWNLMLERYRMFMNSSLDVDFFHLQKDISSESQAIYRCVPRDECVILTIFQEEPVGGLNRSMLPIHYDIQLDGASIDPGDLIWTPYTNSEGKRKNDTISTTELNISGDHSSQCLLQCGDGEALMELAVFEINYRNRGFRIEDATTGNTVTESCPRHSYQKRMDCLWHPTEGMQHIRRCLPAKGCYRLIHAGGVNWDTDSIPLFNITFAGERVAIGRRRIRFDAVDFGSDASLCRPYNAKSMCGQNESLFEFFGSRGPSFLTWANEFNSVNLSWSLTMMSNGPVNSITNERRLLAGNIPPNETLPQYARFCAPSRACMKFTASVPNETQSITVYNTDIEYTEDFLYQLTLGGTIFADSEAKFSSRNTSAPFNIPRYLSESVFLGNCIADDVCNTKTESLLDLSLQVGPDGFHRFPWKVRNANASYDGLFDIIGGYRTTMADTYLSDWLYRRYECLSRNACMQFRILKSNVVSASAEYNISLDGRLVGDRHIKLTKDWFSCNERLETTLGGKTCSNTSIFPSLFIILGCVAGFTLLVYTAWKVRTSSYHSVAVSDEDTESSGISMQSLQ
jgi:hypothetical protein